MSAVLEESVETRVRPMEDSEREEQLALERAASYTKDIPLGQIEEAEIALRDVQSQSEEFLQLVESVRDRGVLQSILVRELPETIPGVAKFGLIDGLQRFTAAKICGTLTIPCNVVTMSDAEALEAQVITNTIKVNQKPAELGRHLVRILTRNPILTPKELARRMNHSVEWVFERMALTKLAPEIQDLVNKDEINLINAYSLTKFDHETQLEQLDAAMVETNAVFVPRMKDLQKQIRDAKNAGRDSTERVFQPTQFMQRVDAVKTEFKIFTGELSGVESKVLLAMESEGCAINDSTKAAVKTALAWILHFDKISQSEQKAKKDEQDKTQKLKAEQRKVEREQKKKADDAAKKSDPLNL